ncbi:uncharacterized protein LOC135332862 [Halichondria panicea]|uniref:uncharacterized protein LOC135332862 n=1 Tax=Halichondria panicea TaxID=6063 RepID=UPI00312B55B5
MLRVQARPSSGESEDIDAAARDDLMKLQRQFRVTEGSRKQYADLAQSTLRKQQAMIESLQAENADLKKNLRVVGSKQNEIKDQRVTAKFDELIEKQSRFQSFISEDERTIHQLDRTILEKEALIAKKRKSMGGALMCDGQHAMNQKQLRVKENRLDKASVRFNGALATNAQLRAMIDHLRRERSVFEGIRKKLQRELVGCKRGMGAVIEMSSQAYESRDDAQNKMLALKEKADKELTQYNTELKEHIRVIDHSRKLKEFMSRKDHERTEAHEAMEAMRRRKDAEKSNERERTVMSYEQAFEKIKEATGITDIDQLVTKFIEVEDQNFALFNYVNELNGEIEMIQEAIQQIKADIEQFKSQGVEMEEKRKTILRGLEEELSSVTDKTGSLSAKFAAATKVLEQLMSGIDSVFSKIGCDSTAITDMLGGHAGVTETTVLQYLGIVEQRTNELLQLQAFLQAKDSDDPNDMTKFLMGQNQVGGLGSSSFALPSTGDDNGSDSDPEDESNPLSTDELKARALKTITKRDVKKPGTARQNSTLPPTAASTKSRGGTDRRSIGTR